MPTHFIIDRSGQIRYSYMGFKEADQWVITEHVIQLINEPQLLIYKIQDKIYD